MENEEKKIKKYIDTKNKQLVKYSILNKRKWFKPFEKRIGLVAGIVYADQYISELGNSLATSNQDVDFIVMIDMGSNKISYRGIKTDKIDLGKFAKSLGGGGHAPAAGSQIDSKINESLIPSLFKPFSVKKSA
ncbi:Oligoribonuclease NrnB [compost metagenome]